MVKSDFRKHVDQFQSLPDDVILGNIVWFSVADGKYDLAELEKWFMELTLNTALLPAETTEWNAFMKATTRSVDAVRPYALPRDTVGEFIAVRDVYKDDEVYVRQLIREVRDSAHKRLKIEPVASFKLYRAARRNGRVERGTHRLRTEIFAPALHPGEEAKVRECIDAFQEEFDRLYNFIDGDKARKLVRDYIEFLNGVMFKSGVYFVHRTRTEELARLAELVNRMQQGCKFEHFPIPELARLRESVIDAYQEEAVKELEEVVALCAKIRSTRKTITPEALAKATEKYQTTMRKATEYGRVMRCSQDRTAGAAEIALEALNALRMDMIKTMEDE